MSAIGGKADSGGPPSECPLVAINGNYGWWFVQFIPRFMASDLRLRCQLHFLESCLLKPVNAGRGALQGPV